MVLLSLTTSSLALSRAKTLRTSRRKWSARSLNRPVVLNCQRLSVDGHTLLCPYASFLRIAYEYVCALHTVSLIYFALKCWLRSANNVRDQHPLCWLVRDHLYLLFFESFFTNKHSFTLMKDKLPSFTQPSFPSISSFVFFHLECEFVRQLSNELRGFPESTNFVEQVCCLSRKACDLLNHFGVLLH